jgi:hypothetical protein
MRRLIDWIAIKWSAFRDRLFVRRAIRATYIGPLLIDRGRGLLYDVERDLTWLQDTNYARTTGRSADGQMTWDDAQAWVAGLKYRGIKGWRLPTALNENGTGPCVGDNCRESELGHLVFTAFPRPSPGAKQAGSGLGRHPPDCAPLRPQAREGTFSFADSALRW